MDSGQLNGFAVDVAWPSSGVLCWFWTSCRLQCSPCRQDAVAAAARCSAGRGHSACRDARAITSHAQKFFIKLAIAGKPLPPRVAETGPGYTLSGRPLDPASAAARAYGLKPDVLASGLLPL